MTIRSTCRTLLLALSTIAVAATSFSVGSGSCTKGCGRDQCFYRNVTGVDEYVIDSSHDFSGNPIDCYLEYWKSGSNGLRGAGTNGTKNGRYGVTELSDPCSTANQMNWVSAGNCSGSWLGNWVFTCFGSCS